MLKRTKVLIALLVVTVICASIGFAAVSDTLTVDGTFVVNVDEIQEDFNADVQFVSATAVATQNSDVEITDPSVANDNSDVNDKLTVTIPTGALTRVNDTVVVTAVVKNQNTKDAVVTLTQNTTITGVVSVTVTETTITAGQQGNVTITFTLTDIPDDTINSESGNNTFSFTLTATSAE